MTPVVSHIYMSQPQLQTITSQNILRKSIAVVVPTYNEKDNIPTLAKRVFDLGLPNIEIVIVDDGSPDGSASVGRKLSHQYNDKITVIERESKQGIGTAYITGFEKALESTPDYIVQMDADLSHSPEYIPKMVMGLTGADVIVGSRYAKGGGVDSNWSYRRKFLSTVANWAIRIVTNLKIRDVTSGFKAYNKNVIEELDFTSIRCKGFGFQTEVAYICQKDGYRILEHPIIFNERSNGDSKLSLEIILEAIWYLILLRFRKKLD